MIVVFGARCFLRNSKKRVEKEKKKWKQTERLSAHSHDKKTNSELMNKRVNEFQAAVRSPYIHHIPSHRRI
jgi:hypothetical protein